jgi:hypothetical protein
MGVTRVLSILLLVGLLVVPARGLAGSVPLPDRAADQIEQSQVILPRAFQQVRLGMSVHDLARIHPQEVTLQGRVPMPESLTQPSNDAFIKRLEYKFHNGALYELRLHYRPHRVKKHMDALLSHLKELYGRPLVDRTKEFDPATLRTEKQTVWNDGRTRIVLLEREKESELLGGIDEILLTLTDLQLEQRKEEASRHQQRQKITRIPVPLPDGTRSKQTAHARTPGTNDSSDATKVF